MINPRTMAKAAAYADIATQSANLQQQQAELDAESSGLDSLSTALTDFQSAIDALNSDTDGPLTFRRHRITTLRRFLPTRKRRRNVLILCQQVGTGSAVYVPDDRQFL